MSAILYLRGNKILSEVTILVNTVLLTLELGIIYNKIFMQLGL